KRAEVLAPYDAGIHAFLGMNYAQLGREKEAAAELKLADSVALDSDLGVRQSLAYGYDNLHDVPRAIEFYENFLSLASEKGIERKETRYARDRVKYLKSRLAPQSFAVPRPEDFSPDKLERFLRSRLTPDEFVRVKCPLVTTDEIKASAQKITST